MSERPSPQPRTFKVDSGRRLDGQFAISYWQQRRDLNQEFVSVIPQNNIIDRQGNQY